MDKELLLAYKDLTVAQIERVGEPVPEELLRNLGEVTLELNKLEQSTDV